MKLANTASRLDVLLITEDIAALTATETRLRERHEVRMAASAQDAIAQIKHRVPDVVVCDHAMSPVTGEELLEIVSTFFPAVRRVLRVKWSAKTGSVPSAEEIIARGLAHVVIDRPTSAEHVLAAIEAQER